MATMRLIGLVIDRPTAFDGQYLKEYDPERDGVEPGTGAPMSFHLVTTPDRSEALDLPAGELMDLWKTVCVRVPVRPDGRPNRPLTSFSVEVTPRTCSRCGGSGYDPTYSGSSQGSPSCQRCQGRGKV